MPVKDDIVYSELKGWKAVVWVWMTYLKKWWKESFLLVIALLAIAGTVSSFSWLLEKTINGILIEGDTQKILFFSLIIFVLFVVRGLATASQRYLSNLIGNNMVKDMRQDLIRRILSLDLKFFDSHSPGDLMAQVGNYAETIRTFATDTTVRIGRDIPTIMGLMFYLIYTQPKFLLIIILLGPILGYFISRTNRKLRNLMKSEGLSYASLITTMDEAFHGIRTVKISNQESLEMDRIFHSIDAICRIGIKRAKQMALLAPIIDIITGAAIAGLIAAGAYFVTKDKSMSPGELVAFIASVMLMYDPLKRIINTYANLKMSLMLLEMILALFDEKPEIKDASNALEKFNTQGDIVFNNVTFSYLEDQKLFGNLNLTIPYGKTTAIVGPTGSGKTTILSLISRLYECQKGTVTIGGTDIRDIKISVLRRALSIVSQDIVIFDDTIEANIRYNAPDIPDSEFQKAINTAQLTSLIHEKGQDFHVGPRGSKLSGGQKQRLAIARSMLRNAPITFLDEATSALDQNTETNINNAIKSVTQDKTVVMIAHRLSAVKKADIIYVINDGMVAQQGTHKSLMQEEGLYKQLFQSQSQQYTED